MEGPEIVRLESTGSIVKYLAVAAGGTVDSGRRLPYDEVLANLAESATFRAKLIDVLSESHGWGAYFFEVAPVTRETASRAPFEFVLAAAPRLDGIRSDPRPFMDYLAENADEDCVEVVVAFRNLGGDAVLVTPRLHESDDGVNEDCRHLGAFMRSGNVPFGLKHALLRLTARETSKAIKSTDGPVWLSTSGTGVHWLHLRIDSLPKYYTFAEYRRFGLKQ